MGPVSNRYPKCTVPSAEWRVLAAVSGRRGRLSPDEHGEQAAGEGQCPNRRLD